MSASGNRQVVWKDGVGIYENAKCAVGGQVILLGRSVFFAKEAGTVFDGAFVDLCSRAFDFCFDGLPVGATLSISTIGVKKEDYNFNLWKAGVDEMIKSLKPKTLLIYAVARWILVR